MEEIRTPMTAWAGSLLEYKGKKYRVVDVVEFNPYTLAKVFRCVAVGSKKRRLKVKIIRG